MSEPHDYECDCLECLRNWRKGRAVHHIDGDPRNSDIENLRIVDIAEHASAGPPCVECGNPVTPEDLRLCAECTDKSEHEEEGRR
jgi:hypothetical protein